MGTDTTETVGVVFANRKEPIPVIHVTPDEQDSTEETKGGVRPTLRDRIKDTFGGSSSGSGADGSSESKFSLQDRMFAAIMSQVIPTDGLKEAMEEDEEADMSKIRKERKAKRQQRVSVDRPDFGPRLMAINFRRFNARIGALFAAQKEMEERLAWKHPTINLTVLAGYTFICLNPYLLPVIPLAALLYMILVPAFLARHPPPDNDPRIEPSYVGPPTAPPLVPKPAPDLSADFWRNARDLQNTMEDVAHLFDLMNIYITPVLNFSDETVTSTLFIGVTIAAVSLLMFSHLIPYQLILLVGGWVVILGSNPAIKKVIEATQASVSPDTKGSSGSSMQQRGEALQAALRRWIEHDIVMDAPEIRQVEIFELQRYREGEATWEPWLFSPTPYVPLSQTRAAGVRPRGTQFFEDVQAPAGWIWKEKKWNLDLVSREWVEGRLITGVEIETQGDRWVYDIPPEELELMESASRRRRLRNKNAPKSGWEEGTGNEKRGEWRRRRWTRLVVKKASIWEDKQEEEKQQTEQHSPIEQGHASSQ